MFEPNWKDLASRLIGRKQLKIALANRPIPLPNSGGVDEWTEETIIALICNPINAGIPPFQPLIDEEVWVKSFSESAKKLGLESLLKVMLDDLRQVYGQEFPWERAEVEQHAKLIARFDEEHKLEYNQQIVDELHELPIIGPEDLTAEFRRSLSQFIKTSPQIVEEFTDIPTKAHLEGNYLYGFLNGIMYGRTHDTRVFTRDGIDTN